MEDTELQYDDVGAAMVVYLPGSVHPDVHAANAAAIAVLEKEHAYQLRNAETLEEAEAKAHAARGTAAPVKVDARRHHYRRGVPREHGPVLVVDGEVVAEGGANPHAGPYKLQHLQEVTTISTPDGDATGIPGQQVLATHVHTGDQHFVALADLDQYER